MNLIERMRARLQALADERAERQEALDTINDTVEARGDDALTEEESTQVEEILGQLRTIDASRAESQTRLDELEENERRRTAAEAEARRVEGANPEPRRQGLVSVNEPTTYRSGGPHSFFVDAFRAVKGGDDVARERLSAHRREMEVLGTEIRSDPERRAVGTGAFGALVVPQYLVDDFAPVLRNARAFANAVRGEPLPEEGLMLVIPRGETGSTARSQNGENVQVSNTDVDFNNDLSVPVRTIAGQQDVSRQTIERGTPGIDRLLYADLVADYAQELDRQIIAADGTAGTHEGVLQSEGINAVTYTDATPTVPEVWGVIADAVQRVATNRKSAAANLITMHPRRWGWFIAARDTTGRPLINTDPSQAMNAMGQAAESFGEGQLVGVLQGLPVLSDGNIPTNLGAGTNEDAIVVLNRQDPVLWEEGDGMPRELRFEEAELSSTGAKLTVRLVIYGYSAFTAERYPVGVSVITGTGLITPTFL